MSRFRLLQEVPMDGGGYVFARQRIKQSPLSSDPDVPKGKRGHVEDQFDGLVAVDFGRRYGTVICLPCELA